MKTMKMQFAALCAAMALAWRRLTGAPAGGSYAAANAIDVGIHRKGVITRLADATFTTRYLLVKNGVAANTVALAGAGDQPLGVALDTAPDTVSPVAVKLLAGTGTLRMVASGAINQGDLLEVAANGQVKTLVQTNGSGTKWVVGVALQAATNAGDLIEVQSDLQRFTF
jgi:Uncharacterized conserved protein (DUF2190)